MYLLKTLKKIVDCHYQYQSFMLVKIINLLAKWSDNLEERFGYIVQWVDKIDKISSSFKPACGLTCVKLYKSLYYMRQFLAIRNIVFSLRHQAVKGH